MFAECTSRRTALWVACGTCFLGLTAVGWLVIFHGMLLPSELASLLGGVRPDDSDLMQADFASIALPIVKRLRSRTTAPVGGNEALSTAPPVSVERDAIDWWICTLGAERLQRREGKQPDCGGLQPGIKAAGLLFQSAVACPYLTATNVRDQWVSSRSNVLATRFGAELPSPSVVGLVSREPDGAAYGKGKLHTSQMHRSVPPADKTLVSGCFTRADRRTGAEATTSTEAASGAHEEWEFDSCAVVGSSGNLEGRNMGDEIDGHDAVFRFSCAPTVGFEDDVGARTTHRFLYPEAMGGASDYSAICGGGVVIPKKDLEQTTALVVLYKEPDVNWWLAHLRRPRKYMIPAPKPCCPYSNVPHPTKDQLQFRDVRFLSYRWLEAVAADFVGPGLEKNTMPKQGVNGIFLALQSCRKVRIYGFGSENEDGSPIRHAHYYDLT
eukprot:g4155.t1